jgi:hypothetical protein
MLPFTGSKYCRQLLSFVLFVQLFGASWQDGTVWSCLGEWAPCGVDPDYPPCCSGCMCTGSQWSKVCSPAPGGGSCTTPLVVAVPSAVPVVPPPPPFCLSDWSPCSEMDDRPCCRGCSCKGSYWSKICSPDPFGSCPVPPTPTPVTQAAPSGASEGGSGGGGGGSWVTKKGYLSAENPLVVGGSSEMTVALAQQACKVLPTCKGFTFMLSKAGGADEKTSIHFKTKIEFTESTDGWQTMIKGTGGSCVSWRNAGGCTAVGPREPTNDLGCTVSITRGSF